MQVVINWELESAMMIWRGTSFDIDMLFALIHHDK